MVARKSYSAKGAVPKGDWKVIRPANNDAWSADYYSTADADLRGNGQSFFTVGVVALVRKNHLYAANFDQALLSCANAGSGGYALYQKQITAAGYKGMYAATVGGTPNTASPDEALVTSDAGHLVMATAVVSDGAYAEDAFYLNATQQASDPWAPANATENLYLGKGTPSDGRLPTQDWLVGWFYHYDPMTNRDLWGLFQNILLAKRIPDADYVGGGTVPDHIFDAASMTVGSDTAPATWTSIGATGGKTMTKTGAIDVVAVNPAFGSRG